MGNSYILSSEERRLIIDIFGVFFLFILLALTVVVLFLGLKFDFILIFQMLFLTLPVSAIGGVIVYYLVWKLVIIKEQEAVSKSIVFAAHQLKAPATGIKWALASLLSDANLSAESKDLATKCSEAVTQIMNIAMELLGAAHFQKADSMHYKDINLVEIAKSIIQELSLRAQGRNIKIILQNYAQSDIMAIVDQDKIMKVINNLIDNAIKYSKQGGEVIVILNKDNKHASITVRDSGIGIPKADQYKIFSGFYRAPNAMAVESNGTGIGLYLCRSIVLQHKGKIWFESAEGKGTAFFVTLPLNHK